MVTIEHLITSLERAQCVKWNQRDVQQTHSLDHTVCPTKPHFLRRTSASGLLKGKREHMPDMNTGHTVGRRETCVVRVRAPFVPKNRK